MTTVQIEVPAFEADETELDYSRRYKLTLQIASRLRVIMGDPFDAYAPDVLIERGVSVWRLFVHPGAGDPVCIVEIGKDRVKVEDDWGSVLLERPLP
jgi:hypothetical protein